MEATKILLSEEELKLVRNSEWLLTKNRIIEKTKDLFAVLAAGVQEKAHQYRENLPESNGLFSPKIFKGEYYEGLPYVMLDYPRIFSRNDVFAMRTMFWWGNFFSVTMHLKGEYHQRYGSRIVAAAGFLEKNDFYVSVSGDEWRHDFREDNYVRVSERDGNLGEANRGEFLKISVKLDVGMWNEAEKKLREKHILIMKLVGGASGEL